MLLTSVPGVRMMTLWLFTPVINIWKACHGANVLPAQNARTLRPLSTPGPTPPLSHCTHTPSSAHRRLSWSLGMREALERHTCSVYGIRDLKAHQLGAWPLLPQDSVSVEKPVFHLRFLGSCQPAGYGTFLYSPPRIRRASFCSTPRK